ncbi:MAG: tripartite tricarboxylate transporter substrate binding protein, partial [Betaproteobacteria bacterium]|nr:tripartite tricarboxylate transporter substrate binding protein [Betaproteobacteria bacterium]
MHQDEQHRQRRLALSRIAGFAAMTGIGSSWPSLARAQAWPTKPVRLIVPFAAGGGTDAFARPLTKSLSATLNQSFVIDNRAGAGGTLGAELAAKSAPDGYNWLVGAVHHTIAVSLYPKLGYDLQKDLIPCTMLASVPNVVVINPQRMPQIKTFADFQKYVKANPGKLNFASAGNGTAHHLIVEMWKTATSSQAQHVPYRGAGPAMADLLAGQVDFMFDGLGTSAPHINTGKLTALAVTTAKRSFALPNVPTLAELGVPGFDAGTWYGLWAPAGTSPETVARLQQEVAKAISSSELVAIWKTLGAEPGGQAPAEFAKLIDAEVRKWSKVVKESGA